MQSVDYTDQNQDNQDELPSLGIVTSGFDPKVYVPNANQVNTQEVVEPAKSTQVNDSAYIQQTSSQQIDETPTLGYAPSVGQSMPVQSKNLPASSNHKSQKATNISGLVRKANGEPINAAFIVVRDERHVMVKVCVTNSAGVFITTLRAPSTYHIEVKHGNDIFEPITLNLVNKSDYNFEVVSLSN